MYNAFLTNLRNFKFPVFAKYGQNTPKKTPKIEKKKNFYKKCNSEEF